MKKLSKLKLNQLVNANLNEEEMNILRGGAGNCCCGCQGSSTTATNNSWNNADDLSSPGCTTGSSTSDDPWMHINTNWDCVGSVNCNNEPNKC